MASCKSKLNKEILLDMYLREGHMPLKARNWQRNIAPSSEKDSGFWDSWGFGMQEQLF